MRYLIKYGILLILTGLLLAGIFYGKGKANAEVCRAVDILIANADSTTFVNPTGLMNELKDLGINPVGKRMGDIDAARIERQLTLSEYVENVECVKAPGGRLLIYASQMVPVMRVFDGDRSYYVNRSGKKMAAIANYHSDVPVVEGHFDKYSPLNLLPLIEYVEGDSLLRSLVTMYCVRDSDNILIVPSISGHVVNLGSADNYQRKLQKLLLFYREVMPAKGWEHYDTISVKWDHQVVATRRKKAVKVEVPIDDESDEPDTPLEDLVISDETHTPAVPPQQGNAQARQQNKPN